MNHTKTQSDACIERTAKVLLAATMLADKPHSLVVNKLLTRQEIRNSLLRAYKNRATAVKAWLKEYFPVMQNYRRGGRVPRETADGALCQKTRS